MSEFLKTIDVWFLVLAVALLGGWFVWSLKNMFGDLKETLRDLRNLITDLFDRNNDHEARLSTLEARCDLMHGGSGAHTGGRRGYDPLERPERKP